MTIDTRCDTADLSASLAAVEAELRTARRALRLVRRQDDRPGDDEDAGRLDQELIDETAEALALAVGLLDRVQGALQRLFAVRPSNGGPRAAAEPTP